MCNHIHTFFGRRHWEQTWNWDEPLCTERGGIQIIFVFVSPLLKGSRFKICIVRYRGDSFSINPISVTEEAFGGENFVWFDWVDVNTCGFTSLHSCCCMSGLVNHPLCKNTTFSQQKELMCQTNPWLVQIFLDLYLKDCLLSRLPCQVCYCLIMLLCGPHWRLRGGAGCTVFLTHIPLMVSNIMIMTICAFKPRFVSQIYQNGKRGHSPPKPSTNYNAKQDSDTHHTGLSTELRHRAVSFSFVSSQKYLDHLSKAEKERQVNKPQVLGTCHLHNAHQSISITKSQRCSCQSNTPAMFSNTILWTILPLNCHQDKKKKRADRSMYSELNVSIILFFGR